jgi:hypothetical protein
MKKVTNTSKNPNPEWLFGGNPNAIENQEAEGQKELVNSDVLPVDIDKYSKYDGKEILENLGFKFLGVVEGDEIFQNVEFPNGWKKEPTDHSMHSNLVDDKGRIRGNIFYKAAFYDRSAHMNLKCRYNYEFDYEAEEKNGIITSHAKDYDGTVIFSTESEIKKEGEARYTLSEKHNNIVKEWLDKNYTDWKNPEKYWNEND